MFPKLGVSVPAAPGDALEKFVSLTLEVLSGVTEVRPTVGMLVIARFVRRPTAQAGVDWCGISVALNIAPPVS